MLALPHTLDELDVLVNPKEDYWTPLVPLLLKEDGWTFVYEDFENWRTTAADFWFFVAVEKQTKLPISCIMLLLDEASANGEDPLFTGGFYYSHPEWRNAGVGMKLFRMMLDTIGDNNVGVNSDIYMSSLYATQFAHDKIRPYRLIYAKMYLKDIVPPRQITGFVAKNLDEVNWQDIVEYDVSIRTRKREKFLRKLLEPSDKVFSKIILNGNGKIVGFGSVRCEIGDSLSVGPLFANNKDIARLIIDSVVPSIDKTKYNYMFTIYPECNLDAERLAMEVTDLKCEIHPYAQPQFTKHIIPVDEMKVFSVSDVAMSFM